MLSGLREVAGDGNWVKGAAVLHSRGYIYGAW